MTFTIRRHLLIPIIIVLLSTSLVRAGEPTLEIGDPAPPFSVTEWLRGEPIDVSDKGDGPIIVLEFWEITCGPCRAMFPELTELQRRHGDRVRIIGVAEDDAVFNSLDRVRHYIGQRSDEMNYSIVYDGNALTETRFRLAAGESGIPFSVVITPDGRIAWLGHPGMGLSRVLDKILDGTYDLEFEKAIRQNDPGVTGAWRDQNGPVIDAEADRTLAYDPRRGYAWLLKICAARMMTDDPARPSEITREAVRALRDHPEELTRFYWKGVRHGGLPLSPSLARTVRSSLEEVMVTTPVTPGIRLAHLDAVMASGSQDEIVETTNRCLEVISPRSPELVRIAWVLRQSPDQEAMTALTLAALDRAVAGRPDSPDVLSARFRILAELGDTEQTLAAARHYADVEADALTLNDFADRLLATYEDERFASVALRAAEAACRDEPLDHFRLDTLAAARFRQGDVQGAVAAQSRAVELAGDDAAPYRQQLVKYQQAAASNPTPGR